MLKHGGLFIEKEIQKVKSCNDVAIVLDILLPQKSIYKIDLKVNIL